jgi:HPr kinase/phosphorylase
VGPDASLNQRETRHATAVAIAGQGVLIEGPSGSGKSALALQLIALGAELIADDRTPVELREGALWLSPPPRLEGVIEARGLGLLRVPHRAGAPLRLVVDMASVETARLPERRWVTLLGQPIRHIRRVDAPHFAGSIVALMRGGWWNG